MPEITLLSLMLLYVCIGLKVISKIERSCGGAEFHWIETLMAILFWPICSLFVYWLDEVNGK